MTLTIKFEALTATDIKWAFTTRRVRRSDIRGIRTDLDRALPGDLVLCEIVEFGQHKNIQLADRRVSTSYPGDLVVLALGDRYAPDQFHASASLQIGELAQLIAGGGLVGQVDAAHAFMKAATVVRPIGLLTDAQGEAVNVEVTPCRGYGPTRRRR